MQGGFFIEDKPMATDLRASILATAQRLGISPIDLATAISYETAGTFDPTKRGPTTQWGQHRGLIQFGEPQAKKYGVDWNDPIGSQLGENGAVARYLTDAGVRPGMGLMDIYSAINAGSVGRNNASDANNGGAPGTVADKVNTQMGGHRQNAMRLFGDADLPDGPKGQEAYAAPSMGSMAPAMLAGSAPANPTGPVPSAVTAQATQQNPMASIFGAMALGNQSQGPQFAPVQIQGPSPDQSMALANFIKSLTGRMA